MNSCHVEACGLAQGLACVTCAPVGNQVLEVWCSCGPVWCMVPQTHALLLTWSAVLLLLPQTSPGRP
jgi:hypothetical protein